jgi:hypothetical protein
MGGVKFHLVEAFLQRTSPRNRYRAISLWAGQASNNP